MAEKTIPDKNVPARSRAEELPATREPARYLAPAVDIYETDKEIVMKAELPEMQEKDIEIKVEDNILIVSGERKMEKEVKEEHYHRIERSYGSFHRSFTLPHTVDRENIKASYKDGVLKVVLPKKEEVKPKQIKIDVAQA